MKLGYIHKQLDLAAQFRRLAAWDAENPDPGVHIGTSSMLPEKALRRAEKHEAMALAALLSGAEKYAGMSTKPCEVRRRKWRCKKRRDAAT